jgi:hypothetical protein
MVLLHDAHSICVVCPHTFRGASYLHAFHSPLVDIVPSKAKANGLRNVTNGGFDWARDRLVLIGTKLGNRAKNSVLRMRFLAF